MRLTPLGVALAEGKTPPAGEPGKRPPLAVSPSAEVIVRDATPLRVWSLSAFAELVELGEESKYRLSETTVRRALAAGFDTRQIATYLARESDAALPAEVDASLKSWSKATRRVRVNRSLTVEPDDAAELEPLAALLAREGLRTRRSDDALIVDVGDQARESRARAALTANGYLSIESGEERLKT
jgi:hypothetical protein